MLDVLDVQQERREFHLTPQVGLQRRHQQRADGQQRERQDGGRPKREALPGQEAAHPFLRTCLILPEAVAGPVDGVDQSRRAVGLELVAQLHHVDVDHVGFTQQNRGPRRFEDRLSGMDLARVP